MLWLGARSYSLYLWHWPVVVWLRPSSQADALELTWVNAARLAITLLCAEASYRWVETRWAHGFKGKPWRRSMVLAVSGLVLVNAGVLGFVSAPQALKPTELPEAPQAASASPAPVTPPKVNGARYQKVTLVGDSVLLGASPYLLRRLPSASVEAKVGRQGSDGLKVVQSLREEAQLGDAAVIHLGTNGYLAEKQFRALLEQLTDRKTVVVVNVYGARRWTSPNNNMIARVSQDFGNVQLVNWHAIGQANPNYFVQDGIHLSGSGIHAYYNQIRMALGQPEAMVSGPTLRQLKRPQLPKPSAQPEPANPEPKATNLPAGTTLSSTALTDPSTSPSAQPGSTGPDPTGLANQTPTPPPMSNPKPSPGD
jgi:hypothetical protein